MRTLQSAIGLKIKAICEMKLVKMLTADVDHRRHITIAGGIPSYSYSQYEHSNRLGNNLLRMRPVCTCTTSLHLMIINLFVFLFFVNMAPARICKSAVYINTNTIRNFREVYIRHKSKPQRACGGALAWVWPLWEREVACTRTIK